MMVIRMVSKWFKQAVMSLKSSESRVAVAAGGQVILNPGKP